MCTHPKIYKLTTDKYSAYCRVCKTKIQLPENWHKLYAHALTVNDYILKEDLKK